MSLRVSSLQLENFRNHNRFLMECEGHPIVLIGKNGVGKTNILEALQLITSGFSFRHPRIEDLIGPEALHARVSAVVEGDKRGMEITLSIEPSKRTYEINGKKKNLSEIKNTLPSVMFSPEDLNLVKKSSQVKRQSLDELGSQISQSYRSVSDDYEKLIRHKNKLLKENPDKVFLESINETLLVCGTQLINFRRNLFERFTPILSEAYRFISQESEVLSASYFYSWDYVSTGGTLEGVEQEVLPKEDIKKLAEENIGRFFEEEIRRGRSLIGPHNDKVFLLLNTKDASKFASQGQQRSIALAWKFAESEMINQAAGVKPLLLLDDVMSELDTRRRSALIDFVKEDMQSFITSTDLSGFDDAILKNAQILELSGDE